MSRDFGCKYCHYYHTLMFSNGKHMCVLKPEYILDRFTKRKPKWCPLMIKKENH